MKKLEFSIEIETSKEKVWHVLWDDKTFRDWASIIDEGTYMVGNLREGNKVQFISSVGGYGVTSMISKLIPNEFVSFNHNADTKEYGESEREDEWTGGTESYSLSESNDVTTLKLTSEVPPSQEKKYKDRFPKALERIKY